MPHYTVITRDTKQISDLPLMSFEDLQKFLGDNQNYELVMTQGPSVKVN